MNEIVTKSILIDRVAESAGITKKAAEASVKAVLDTITNALASGDKVQLIGFGTFEVKHRKQRTMKHPQTQIPMVVPATNVAVFRAGSVLKDAVK